MLPMPSTMSDYQLTIGSIFEHGVRVHAESEVITWMGDHPRRATYREVGERVRRLACALQRLGIRPGDRVGTFCWNHQEHIEAYYSISSMGAVAHTLNIRLFPDQLSFVINHGEDRIILVDASLYPALASVLKDLRTVEHIIVIGDASGLPENLLRYENLLAAEQPEFIWPDLDERSAAVMCHTTGTTGDPKGVVYSHRSIYLHALGVCAPWCIGISNDDRVLCIVPLFHANGWGIPYAGWFAGSDFLMPGPYLQPEPLCRFISTCRPNVSSAIPTILGGMLRHAVANKVDLSMFRVLFSGGAALPRSIADGYRKEFNVPVVQGWGMTETSPVAASARPPRQCPDEEITNWTTKTGRMIPGVDMRICDGDTVLPWDGQSVGEIEVRGPWITASYYGNPAPERFHDGWLRTGDVGVIDERGYLRITDRSKDVIKSGGEWISSVELENAITDHPDVVESAVIGVPDDRWDERPLACVVTKTGAPIDFDDLRSHLATRVARWWIPERWAFISEIPKTSVGKYDKKALRAQYAKGSITEIVDPRERARKESLSADLVG
ncbi:MAG TPA: fatty acid--CoA ligase [Terracidiphilus sp.]|jgi:fatty-acyl-CoA synthase